MLPTQNLHFLSAFCFSLLQFFFFLSLANPDETTALLAFKSASDPFNSLSSWTAGSDPCSCLWLGVTCDPDTRRVTKLVLQNLNLSGSTRPLAQLAHLGVLSLNHNLLSSINVSSWTHLNHLYLSHNRFAGALPAGISRLRHLRRLDLSHNQFSGEIPLPELTQLPHLLTLRLESNSFTGSLTAGEFISGSILDFNVSHNNLWGEIPPSLSKFAATSFSGNYLLCGDPLPLKCPYPTAVNLTDHQSRRASKRNDSVLVISIVGVVVVLLLMGVTATWCFRTKRRRNGGVHKKTTNGRGYASKRCGLGELKRKEKKPNSSGVKWAHNGPMESEGMVVLEGCSNGVDKVGDLLKASAEMLGKGSVGTTFKVAVDGGDGGDTVAVKRVREKRNGGKEIDGFFRQIGGLRHPNIVSLRAYHNSSFEVLLVYDFLPKGSLHFALHGNRGPGRTPLSWDSRLRLASGSAEGLAFLHGSSKDKPFHGNLTSSNILVDQLGIARIADIGLHQLITSPISVCSAYQAPELKPSCNKSQPKFTQKCDVYSFGVVVLEILTGRVAAEEGEVGLVEWVKTAVAKKDCRTWEVMDFELFGDKEMEKEMWALLEVGLLCLTESAKDRPTMGIVHRMIEDITKKGFREDGAKSILDELTSDSSFSLSETTS